MRIIRTPAVQGHAIPSKAGYPVGPFNPEVLAQSVIVDDEHTEENFPYGATVQNGMHGVTLYRCTYCGGTVTEDEVDIHVCGES